MMKHTFYVALGSNIGDSVEYLQKAVNAFNLVPETKITAVSNIYETEPWGYAQQNNFMNCVIKGETSLSPAALLGVCLGIEGALGRKREIKNGPRVLDADLLLFDRQAIDTEELSLPHPRMFERGFVMVPLMDIYEGENQGDFAQKTALIDKSDIKITPYKIEL